MITNESARTHRTDADDHWQTGACFEVEDHLIPIEVTLDSKEPRRESRTLRPRIRAHPRTVSDGREFVGLDERHCCPPR